VPPPTRFRPGVRLPPPSSCTNRIPRCQHPLQHDNCGAQAYNFLRRPRSYGPNDGDTKLPTQCGSHPPTSHGLLASVIRQCTKLVDVCFVANSSILLSRLTCNLRSSSSRCVIRYSSSAFLLFSPTRKNLYSEKGIFPSSY